MTEENRSEILQKLIYSAQNENKFTLLDLKDYLLGEHVVADEDIAFFRDEMSKMGLLIEEDDADDGDFIEEPTSDDIEEIEDVEEEDDELLGDEEDDEDLNLIEEPTNEDLDKVEEEESDDEDEDEDEDECVFL